MDYHGKYPVDPADIVDGAIKWKSTGSGAYIISEYKGVKYFVKRYTMGPRIPAKSIPEPVYSQLLEGAEWLENKQKEIRDRFKSLTVDGDHIVKEEDNFWDEDNLFVTITRMIPNENVGFDYSTLDFATFVKLCSDIATLIKKAHDAGVTHGDLKNKNILIQKNGSDLIPYLIDFDSSYPSDYGTRAGKNGKPMLSYPVVFSEGYQSPEIAIYNFEDEGVIDPSTITNKTDIFTLAVIFHNLWTGTFPAVIDDNCSVGEAIYMNGQIRLDPKFDVVLGSNNESKFSSLLMWMLAKDATQRPTAQQVIDVLADNLEVDDAYEIGEGASKFDTEPHDVHKAALEIFKKDTLKKKNVKSFRKVTENGKYKYLVKLKDGTEQVLTIDEVISNGYGRATKTSLCELWEEDSKEIEFLPTDQIAAMGVVAIEAVQAGYRKFYYVAQREGGYTTGRVGLLDRGLARKRVFKPDGSGDVDADAPWPEHGMAYDKVALKSRHVIKVEKVEEGGEKKYQLTTQTDAGRSRNIVKVNYMKIMKFIIS